MINRKAWAVLSIAFFAGIAMAWSQNKIIPIISEIMDIFQVDKVMSGWLSSIFCIMGCIIAIPAAMLMKKYGIKKSGLVALVLTIIGSAIGLWSKSFDLLLFSRIVEGIGVGIISVVAPTVISMWFPAEKRGLPMGIWGSWQMIAQGANFFLATSLTATFGWRGMWWFGIAISIIAMILYALIVCNPDNNHNYAPINKNHNMVKGLFSKSSWEMAIAGLAFTFAYFGWVTWIAEYWVMQMNVSTSSANTYLGYMCIIEIPVVFLVGYILDKVKNRKAVAFISCLMYIVVLFYSYRMTNADLIIPFIITYPIVEGGIPTVLWTLIPQTAKEPENTGSALAILTIGMNLGTVIGAPVIGCIIERFGFEFATYPLCMAVAITALLIWKAQIYNRE